MSPQSDVIADLPVPERALSATRPFYWSVRRELWENRSIYMAPAIAAAVVLLGFFISMFTLSHSAHVMVSMDDTPHSHLKMDLYGLAAVVVVMTMHLVSVFYCLGSLHSERRDRSILFWKSLPVSDLTTVLAKASVPFVILPLVTFALVVVMQLILQVMISMASVITTINPAVSIASLNFQQRYLVLSYGLVASTLWYAPIYGWLMLISGWARRATFLWAVLPPLAICVLEALALRSSNIATLLYYRLTGATTEAFVDGKVTSGMINPDSQPDLVGFFGSPGLWSGLAVAVVFLVASIWMRRYREPI